jgi:hypothetical protein
MSSGLPQEGAYETVLRDALAVDSLAVPGVYFGTRSGKLFASRDGGAAWRAIAEGLPPILCVKTAVVQKAGRSARPARVARAKPVAPGARARGRARA